MRGAGELAVLVIEEQRRLRERKEAAVQVLHARRHWATPVQDCARCPADVEAVAAVLLPD